MSQTNAVTLCLAYIIGLLSTSVSWWGGYGIIAIGCFLGCLVKKIYGRESFINWRKFTVSVSTVQKLLFLLVLS